MIAALIDHNNRLKYLEDTKIFKVNFCDLNNKLAFEKQANSGSQPRKNTLTTTNSFNLSSSQKDCDSGPCYHTGSSFDTKKKYYPTTLIFTFVLDG